VVGHFWQKELVFCFIGNIEKERGGGGEGGGGGGAKRKKGGEGRTGVGERSQVIEKEEDEWEKTTPVLPLIDSGTVFVFLESQMHITPLSFEN
jgi:hypothetical protein